jgi:hypothetical protein
MHRVVAFALVLIFTVPLQAASIRVRWVSEVASCGTEADFRRSIERRVGIPLEQLAEGPQQIDTEFVRAGMAWVAKIAIRDQSGRVIGDRALRVNTTECRTIAEYAALTVSLMLETESQSAPASATPTEAAGDPELEHPPPPEPKQDPKPAPTTSPADAPRTWGTGPEQLQLFRSLILEPDLHSPLDRQAVEFVAAGLRRRLLPSDLFTIVEPNRGIEPLSELDEFVRQTSQGASPRGRADHAIIPVFHVLALQRGLNFSVTERDAVVVVVHCSIHVVSRRFHEAWPPLEIRQDFALRGKITDPSVKELALRLAMERVVEEAMAGLRQYPPFRLRLRILSSKASSVEFHLPAATGIELGDTFVFEGDDGKRAGLANVVAIEGNSGTAKVYASGSGSRLSERGKYRAARFGVQAFGAWRRAYRSPSPGDAALAAATQRYPRELGTGADLGIGLELLYVPRVSPLRVVGVVRIAGANNSYPIVGPTHNGSIATGLAYEIPLLRSLGLTFSPHLRGGFEVLHGSFGPHWEYAIHDFRAVTSNAGFSFAFYGAGSWSGLFGFEYQLSLPVHSATPASAFLHDQFPVFDALIFSAGLRSEPLDVAD